jgi:hypothetical protein
MQQPVGDRPLDELLAEVIEEIRLLGDPLGEEIVLTLGLQSAGDVPGMLFLAEVEQPAAFRSFLKDETARANAALEEKGAANELLLRVVEDPFSAVPAGTGRVEVLVWVGDDVVAAALHPAPLQEVAAVVGARLPSPFVDTPFHERITGSYREGTGWLLAMDMERILDNILSDTEGVDPEAEETMRRMGLLDLRHLVLERREEGDESVNRAVVDFGGARSGMASWLAEPAPMGSLEFVSPQATMAMSFVVKDPLHLLEDLYGIIEASDEDALRDLVRFEEKEGVSIRRDFAAPLGGEFVVALDGPVFPTPAWKVVVEVYDPVRLQQTVEWAVRRINEEAREAGRGTVVLETTQVGGRSWNVLRPAEGAGEVHYVFVDGYLIAAPRRVLLERAIQYRDTGYTLTSSPEFAGLLPRDGGTDFSGLLYQDMMGVLEGVTRRLGGAAGEMTPQQQAILQEMQKLTKPTLGCVYGERDRIVITTRGQGGLFGGADMGNLLSLGGAVGLQKLVEEMIDSQQAAAPAPVTN